MGRTVARRGKGGSQTWFCTVWQFAAVFWYCRALWKLVGFTLAVIANDSVGFDRCGCGRNQGATCLKRLLGSVPRSPTTSTFKSVSLPWWVWVRKTRFWLSNLPKTLQARNGQLLWKPPACVSVRLSWPRSPLFWAWFPCILYKRCKFCQPAAPSARP